MDMISISTGAWIGTPGFFVVVMCVGERSIYMGIASVYILKWEGSIDQSAGKLT